MAVTVTLNWHEVMMASHVGLWRRVSAIKNGKRDLHGYEGAGWDPNLEGACGELAAAKALGLYWDGSINTWKQPDVGNLHVRTMGKHHYDLLIRPGDDDEGLFVLVTGKCPEFRVHGWIRGRDAKNQDWIKNHGNRSPAYFVPQSMLAPLSDLEKGSNGR
jgi:hypothetical protein